MKGVLSDDIQFTRSLFLPEVLSIYDHYYFSIFSLLFIIVFIIVLSSYLSAVAPRRGGTSLLRSKVAGAGFF